MWRVVVARSDENSTLLSSEITQSNVGGVGSGGGHISSLTAGPATSHHWGYPPPPHHHHHSPYQPAAPGPHQHPEMRHHHHHHHHEMRGPDLRHGTVPSGAIVELRHDMQRTDLRIHQPDMRGPEVRHGDMQRAEITRHPDMHRGEMATRQQQQPQQQQQQHPELRHQDLGHQDMTVMRPDLTELRPSHELPELKIDGAELRTRETQQQQQQQQTSHQRGSLKRAMSDSDCDDVFSEESGKEPCNSPGGDSCQHASRKRRRGMIEKKRRDRINASLGELRRLVPAAARDPHSGKLEKAEILQLTVEHLRTLRTKGPEGYDSTKLAMDYHAVGWGECAAEVGRYLVTMEGLDERDPLRLRLLSHLQSFHREHPTSGSGATLGSSASLASSPSATSYEPPQSSVSAGMGPGTGSIPPILGGGTIGWGQYPGQYPQQQHGKPYRPWGAELAY